MDGVQQLDQLIPLLDGVWSTGSARPARRTRRRAPTSRVSRRARAHDRRRHRVRARLPRRAAPRPQRPSSGRHGRRSAGGGPWPSSSAAVHAPGAHERTIAVTVRRGAGRDVRPLRRVRRPRPRLGPGHRHRPALRPARRLVAEVDAFARAAPRPGDARRRHVRRRDHSRRPTPARSSGSWPSPAASFPTRRHHDHDPDAHRPRPRRHQGQRQQATWATGDYAVIGTTLQIVGESLCEAVDVVGRLAGARRRRRQRQRLAGRRPPRLRGDRHRLRRGPPRRGAPPGRTPTAWPLETRVADAEDLPVRRRHLRRRAVDLRRDVHARPRPRRRRAGPGLPARRPHRAGQLDPRGLRRPDVQDRRAPRPAARRRPLTAPVGHRGPSRRAVRRRRASRSSPPLRVPLPLGQDLFDTFRTYYGPIFKACATLDDQSARSSSTSSSPSPRRTTPDQRHAAHPQRVPRGRRRHGHLTNGDKAGRHACPSDPRPRQRHARASAPTAALGAQHRTPGIRVPRLHRRHRRRRHFHRHRPNRIGTSRAP